MTAAALTRTGIARAEWTKLRTLRSTTATLGLAAAVTVALGPVVIAAEDAGTTAEQFARITPDGVSRIVYGTYLTPLFVGLLGVLTFTGEYTSGLIRSTLAAVPRRLPVLGAKAATLGLAGFAAILASTAVSFLICRPLLAHAGVDVSFGAPGVARAVVGAGLFVGLVGVIGVALGAILRNTTAGAAALVALLYLLPPLIAVLPGGAAVVPFLPWNAGLAMLATTSAGAPFGGALLSPGAGLLALCGHTAVAVCAAAVVLARRDA